MAQKNRSSILQKLLVFFVALVLAGMIMNVSVSIRAGVDGHYRTIRMPLYVKWTEFLARHYEYARIAREITAGSRNDEDKAIAILNWTRQNIKDQPKEFRVVDDHILYIIIRGYGVPEQLQDVFATLCSYSNLPAFWMDVPNRDKTAKYALSFVMIDGKWCVFDSYRDKYFKTAAGRIASVEDIMNDRSILKGDDIGTLDLKHVVKPVVSRSEKQMPLHRIIYELKRALKLEKDDGGSE